MQFPEHQTSFSSPQPDRDGPAWSPDKPEAMGITTSPQLLLGGGHGEGEQVLGTAGSECSPLPMQKLLGTNQ